MMGQVGNFVLIKSSIKATCRSTFLKDIQKLIHKNGKYCKIKHYKRYITVITSYKTPRTSKRVLPTVEMKSTKVSIPFTSKLDTLRQPYPHAIVISLRNVFQLLPGLAKNLHSSPTVLRHAFLGRSIP